MGVITIDENKWKYLLPFGNEWLVLIMKKYMLILYCDHLFRYLYVCFPPSTKLYAPLSSIISTQEFNTILGKYQTNVCWKYVWVDYYHFTYVLKITWNSTSSNKGVFDIQIHLCTSFFYSHQYKKYKHKYIAKYNT